jgi:hypothetical protein
MDLEATVQALKDRVDVIETMSRYAYSIDVNDFETLRSTLADDMTAQYANMHDEPLDGADTVVQWVNEATTGTIWQHHLISVYTVEIDGDTAKALVYHTSYQNYDRAPETADVLVGRYHNEFVRTPDGWKISKLLLEVLWGEQRQDAVGYFETVGGRGPIFQ